MITRNEIIKKLLVDLEKYSPVLITGGAGSGKTYILKTLADSMFDKKPEILAAEKIRDSFVEAIKNSQKADWKKEMLSQPVLLIDDIDFLENTQHTKEMLISVLENYDKPIVVTSEKPLNAKDFSESYVSFFSKGAHVHLETLTAGEIREYLQKSILENGLCFTDNAAEFMYNHTFPNYASIQGFIKTAILYSQDNQPIALEECQRILFHRM